MRIVNLPASIAVLLLAALLFLVKLAGSHSSPLSSQTESNDFNSKESASNQEISAEEPSSGEIQNMILNHHWMSPEHAEKLLTLEGHEAGNTTVPVDCCPSIMLKTSPEAGLNVKGELVQLYKDGETRQEFYEVSCKEGVADQPCRFMLHPFHNRSRCVQKYSYSYAIVKQPNDTIFEYEQIRHQSKKFSPTFANEPNRHVLDYIQIRSGCSCEIMPKKKKSSKVKRKKKKASGP